MFTVMAESCSTTHIVYGAAVAGPVTILVGFWFLGLIARRYPPNPKPVPRRFGILLQASALVCGLVMLALFWGGPTRHADACGNPTGLAATAEGPLFLAAVVGFVLGVTVAADGAVWVAIAAVAVADVGLLELISGATSVPHRGGAAVVLVVHGVCTAVASYWARDVRGGEPAARAKGSEAGRTLAVAWPVLMLLRLVETDGGRRSGIASSAVVSLFIVSAIPLVMGTGYTKYAEARASLSAAQCSPQPDAIDKISEAVGNRIRRFTEWLLRYSEWS